MEQRRKNLAVTFTAVVLLSWAQISWGCHPCYVKDAAHNYLVGAPMRCEDNQVLHRQSKTCYDKAQLGYDPIQGTCGENMVLTVDETNPKYAKCVCDSKRNPRPLVYSAKTDQCYFLYTQATCPPGKWLVFENDGIKCSQNICAQYASNEDQVLLDGLCAPLQARCGPNGRGTVGFEDDTPVPTCKLPKFSALAIGAVGAVRCPQNAFRSTDGRGCQEPIYIDFD